MFLSTYNVIYIDIYDIYIYICTNYIYICILCIYCVYYLYYIYCIYIYTYVMQSHIYWYNVVHCLFKICHNMKSSSALAIALQLSTMWGPTWPRKLQCHYLVYDADKRTHQITRGYMLYMYVHIYIYTYLYTYIYIYKVVPQFVS